LSVCFTAAIRIDPDDAEAYNNRGVDHRELGNDVKADADFARAKELGFKP
jgi:Flp pilus assembly protein TadD